MLFALAFAGCTHTMPLRPSPIDPMPIPGWESTPLLVVLDEAMCPDRLEASADGHSYVYENVHFWLRETITAAWLPACPRMRFVTAAPTSPEPARLYPRVHFELDWGLLTKTSRVTVDLALRRADRPEIAVSSTKEESFVFVNPDSIGAPFEPALRSCLGQLAMALSQESRRATTNQPSQAQP